VAAGGEDGERAGDQAPLLESVINVVQVGGERGGGGGTECTGRDSAGPGRRGAGSKAWQATAARQPPCCLLSAPVIRGRGGGGGLPHICCERHTCGGALLTCISSTHTGPLPGSTGALPHRPGPLAAAPCCRSTTWPPGSAAPPSWAPRPTPRPPGPAAAAAAAPSAGPCPATCAAACCSTPPRRSAARACGGWGTVAWARACRSWWAAAPGLCARGVGSCPAACRGVGGARLQKLVGSCALVAYARGCSCLVRLGLAWGCKAPTSPPLSPADPSSTSQPSPPPPPLPHPVITPQTQALLQASREDRWNVVEQYPEANEDCFVGRADCSDLQPSSKPLAAGPLVVDPWPAQPSGRAPAPACAAASAGSGGERAQQAGSGRLRRGAPQGATSGGGAGKRGQQAASSGERQGKRRVGAAGLNDADSSEPRSSSRGEGPGPGGWGGAAG
jgi:hypothetical protein